MESIDFLLPSVGWRAEIEAGMAATRPDYLPTHAEELTRDWSNLPTPRLDSVALPAPFPHRGFWLPTTRCCWTSTSRCRPARAGRSTRYRAPATDPIRVAEDIAMLDAHDGRTCLRGFARGYQRRWVDMVAQRRGGVSGTLPHHHDAIDRTNRERSRRTGRFIKKAGPRRC